jgi:predicted transcriptional regulator
MSIKDCVKIIIKANNETPYSFADKIYIKRFNLSHVLSGRNKPSLDFLSKIISSYPSVNASLLITKMSRDGEFEESSREDKDQF